MPCSAPASGQYIRSMPASNILIVVIDGLRAAALGAYGNTMFPTPALDEFAAGSVTFDRCFAPAIELEDVYRALWQSRHPLRYAVNGKAGEHFQSLPAIFAARGYATTLVTDEAALIEFRSAHDFDECIQLTGEESPKSHAAEISATQMAAVFAPVLELVEHFSQQKTAIGQTATHAEHHLIWLHTRGMHGPWDVPLDLQASLLDEGETPIESTTPPNRMIDSNDDPDLAFRYSAAYAAQVMVFDKCWQELRDAIATSDEPWLVMLLGARGYSLGEHGRIGGKDGGLPVEQLHVPWLIEFPDGRGKLLRSDALVSHLDVLPTIADGAQIHLDEIPTVDGLAPLSPVGGNSTARRWALLSTARNGSTHYSIRTSNWCLRGSADQPNSSDVESSSPTDSIRAGNLQLFVQPDDRWEANDVSKLCPEVVDELQQLALDCMAAAATNEPMQPLLLAPSGAASSN